MIIYRAMSDEELALTLKYKKPDFSKSRFKWFSANLDFIKNRVKDGLFNNSRFCQDRYKNLVKFEVDEKLIDNRLEIQVDRRKNVRISFIEIVK